jgi:hypothetical protein
MKRQQRWSQASDEGPGHRASPSGPFRRRRAMRHLDSLALHPAPELSSDAAVAHVRVIGEAGPTVPERTIVPAQDDTTVNASDRLRAVPINEPLGRAAQST